MPSFPPWPPLVLLLPPCSPVASEMGASDFLTEPTHCIRIDWQARGILVVCQPPMASQCYWQASSLLWLVANCCNSHHGNCRSYKWHWKKRGCLSFACIIPPTGAQLKLLFMNCRTVRHFTNFSSFQIWWAEAINVWLYLHPGVLDSTSHYCT